jgi:regulation of enolase protein 1 (concanavalin A-like superfamily)
MADEQFVKVAEVGYIDRGIRVVERLGMMSAIVAYFLYKDWIFTSTLVANQVQIILTQTQITVAIEQLARAALNK